MRCRSSPSFCDWSIVLGAICTLSACELSSGRAVWEEWRLVTLRCGLLCWSDRFRALLRRQRKCPASTAWESSPQQSSTHRGSSSSSLLPSQRSHSQTRNPDLFSFGISRPGIARNRTCFCGADGCWDRWWLRGLWCRMRRCRRWEGASDSSRLSWGFAWIIKIILADERVGSQQRRQL